MPNWPDAAAFARDVERMGRDMARDEAKRITGEAAREAQVIAYRAAAKDLGGDPKFSGWRPWLEVKIKPTRNFGHVIHPTRQSAGPWTVAEVGRNKGSGTGGSFLGPGVNRRTGETRFRKDGSVAKVRSFKSKRWNGYTAGKNTASDAVAEIERKVDPIIDREFRKSLSKHFDVF